MRTCVIGAGLAGLVTVKYLSAREVPFDCYERRAELGGIWSYSGDGRSPLYDACHAIASKNYMSFSDFPMPAEYPQYLKHTYIREYLHRYAETFKLADKITYNTAVHSARPVNGKWEVILDSGKTQLYDALVVANGHFTSPKLPDIPGKFEGKVLHTIDYGNAEDLRNKRVVILGAGNSSADITCEVARVADKTFLAMRRGMHIIPKYILGKPFLDYATPSSSRLPMALQRASYHLLLWIGRGSLVSYGYPKPDHRLLNGNPTVSSELLERIGHGDVIVKPAIRRFDVSNVVFNDGSQEQADCVIYATGYRVGFPFFSPEVFAFDDERMPNYWHVVNMNHPNLYFVGLIEPLGANPVVFESQARWVAELLNGTCALPPKEEMTRTMLKFERTNGKRFGSLARRSLQVDYFPYLSALKKEMRRVRNA